MKWQKVDKAIPAYNIIHLAKLYEPPYPNLPIIYKFEGCVCKITATL